MKRNYNPDIVDAYRNYLEGEKWHYTFEERTGYLRFGMNLRGKLKTIQYAVCVKDDECTVYAVSPVSADANDPEQMRQMEEFVCRANYGLRDGNFEIDVNDGELRYKSYVNCEEDMPSEERIKWSIYCPAAMFERFGNGILQIVVNNLPARDAIKLSEGYRLPSELTDDDVENDDDSNVSENDDEDEDESETTSLRELLRLIRGEIDSMGSDSDSEDDPE